MTRYLWYLFAVAVVGSAVGVGLYYGWRWYATMPPEPPDVNLADAEPLVAHVVQKALTAVRDKPRSAESWGHLGMVLGANGYSEDSRICFATAERLDPKDPRWPYFQGLKLRVHEPDAALPFVRRTAELCDQSAPDKTAPRLLLAEMLLAKGKTAEAEMEIKKALSQAPEDVRANFDMGLAAFARDDNDECIRYLTRASASPFAQKKVAAQLAMVYARLNDDKTAAEFDRRARDLPADIPFQDPYLGEFEQFAVGRQDRLAKVEQLEKEGRLPGEGLQILGQLLEELPDDRTRVALGITLVKVGDNEAAVRVLRDALKQAPEKMQAHYFLSLALFRQAEKLRDQGAARDVVRLKFREAEEAARQAAKLKPDHAQSHLMCGLALRQLNERAGAIASFRRAVECRPEMVETHQYLGETLAANGQDLEALGELGVALELGYREPQAAEKARQLYARVLLRTFLPLFP